jgi:hypothetical protein
MLNTCSAADVQWLVMWLDVDRNAVSVSSEASILGRILFGKSRCEKTATSGSERLNEGSAADVYWILTRVDVERNAVSVSSEAFLLGKKTFCRSRLKKCASFQGRDVEQMCSC